jgi:outer membrane protein OmpA-like peptidoglycan-associated protein
MNESFATAMGFGIHLGLGVGALGVAVGLPSLWVEEAKGRLAAPDAEQADAPAIASAADEGYCTPELKKVLRRVLQSCGLLSSGEVRGCQPVEAKSVATLAGDDFNALFLPLKDRAGIIQFDQASGDLDPGDLALVDRLFADQRGASWFFVVARSSPEGSPTYNRDLSQKRGKAVLDHLKDKFGDADLDHEVGLLWLGEEYAQLDKDFCDWSRSGDPVHCGPAELNRSAFVAWIDCRL